MGLFKKDKKTGDEILFSCKWVEVRRKDGWHIYTHSPWINGVAVAVLAYRKMYRGNRYEYEYVGRYEISPSHSPEPQLCSITGGYDNSHKYSLVQCALNELREEGGWDAPEEAVMELGTAYPGKSSDTVQHLYAVNLDYAGVKPCEATSDGTKGEHGSYAKWVTEEDIVNCSDPLNHTMLLRLQKALR